MQIVNLKEIREINSKKVSLALTQSAKYFGDPNELHIRTIIAAYVINEMQNTVVYDTFENYMTNSDMPSSIKSIVDRYQDGLWETVQNNLSKFSSYELLSFILFDNSYEYFKRGDCSTPSSILKLAQRLLDIKTNDRVLELCSGKGNFLVEMATNGISADYCGVELNYIQKDIAVIRASLISDNYSYILSDALEYKAKEKVDKIFSNYPFGLRLLLTDDDKEKLSENYNIPYNMISKISVDWLFNLSIINQLKENGKAVVIMTNGSTLNLNVAEKNIRRYFVENGYIEAVISLPGKLFDSLSIPVSMFLLSHGNKSVRLIDAKDLFISARKQNMLNDENIDEISKLMTEDSNISIVKTTEELANNEYVLNASRYFDNIPEIKNGVEFGSVIKKITRGSQMKASDLDEYKSDVPTKYKYLLLANINDGVASLDNDDQYLKEIPAKLEKYCIKNNAIVLSKIGAPNFKSAVVQIEKGTKVLANGNLFVIELDENKANPFYVQAFLASDLGANVLKNIYTGATLLTINIEKLKEIKIPLPSLEEQSKIANKYAALMDQQIMLKRKLEKTKDEMRHVFEEE